MVIYIGADHRGFKLKEYLKQSLASEGYEVVDLGNTVYDEQDDYPDFAVAVAKKVSLDENSRGILICGNGAGMDIVANKFMNVRSALASSSDQAFDSRNDDNTNVLSLAADYLAPEETKKILTTWLSTPFDESQERFKRRLHKISQLELRFIRPLDEDEEK